MLFSLACKILKLNRLLFRQRIFLKRDSNFKSGENGRWAWPVHTWIRHREIQLYRNRFDND